jgi:4-hydroxy-3-methylbut-2-enyl diphosphate reductase
MLHPSAPATTRTSDIPPDRHVRALRVVLAAPRGFCAGVRRAIDAVLDAIDLHGAPVYVRRPIVHNLEVVRDLEAKGAVFVQELDQVPEGSIVLFSAHGVAPAVAEDAKQRGLIAYDAVCPLVAKVHREVERHQRYARQLVVIGHEGHPEIEGTLGHVAPGSAHVVSSAADVADLPLDGDAPTAFAVQTTYSVDDAAEIVAALRERFSSLSGPATSDICYATTNRQAAVRSIAAQVDAVIVAGERFSSNATRLSEVAAGLCGSVQLVSNPGEIDWSLLGDAGSVGITAAASTPESSVQAILGALRSRYRVDVEEIETVRESTVFKRLAVA